MQATVLTSSSRAAVRGVRLQTARSQHASARRAAPVRTQAFVGDVGKYLGEAASQIFYPTRSSVPWQGSAQPFTGRIVHHDEVPRLRSLLREVQAARQDLEAQLEEKPAESEADVPEDSQIGDFVTTSIERVMGRNFTGDEAEPKWSGGGYRGSWKSQRDVRREYARLARFERVVRQTLDKAEVKN